MRLIALDIGEKRIGVAVSDAAWKVATPLVVLDASLDSDVRPLKRIVDDYEAAAVVVGLPLTMSGEEGPQAEQVREQADYLRTRLGIPVVFQDERLSSAEARRIMADSGVDQRRQRGTLDMVAASIVLQAYLDSDGPIHDGIATDD